MTTVLDCGHVAASVSEDGTHGECAECGRPNIIAHVMPVSAVAAQLGAALDRAETAMSAVVDQLESDVARAQKDAEIERLVVEMQSLPEYRGWHFSYEYPGYFCYTHPDSDYSIFFTPDHEGDETLPIEVQRDDGTTIYEYGDDRLPLPREGRTAQKIFDLVRPTLDKILAKPPEQLPSMSDVEIEALAEEAINAACKIIQDRLGVTSGDLAAMTLSDGTLERELGRYIRAELDAARSGGEA